MVVVRAAWQEGTHKHLGRIQSGISYSSGRGKRALVVAPFVKFVGSSIGFPEGQRFEVSQGTRIRRDSLTLYQSGEPRQAQYCKETDKNSIQYSSSGYMITVTSFRSSHLPSSSDHHPIPTCVYYCPSFLFATSPFTKGNPQQAAPWPTRYQPKSCASPTHHHRHWSPRTGSSPSSNP